MRFWAYWEKLAAENGYLKVANVVLALALVFVCIVMAKMSVGSKVVIIPPRINQEFWVAGDEVSVSYLEQTAYFITDRLLSVNPKTVDRSYAMILPFLSTDPETLTKLKVLLAEQTDAIKEENISQVFYPLSFSVGENYNYMVVTGEVLQQTGSIYIGSKTVHVKIWFKIKGGRLTIRQLVL